MTPRPRTVDDAAILGAAYQAIARVGPATFTLADVAKECGLAAPTLVQRFGSKRGLLLALARSGAESIGGCFAAVRAQHPRPLDALLAAATEMARTMDTPEEIAHGLAFLQMDVADPEFRKLAVKSSRGILAGYGELLDEAVAAGELVPCDTAALARAIGSLSGGALFSWAILREGTAASFVRDSLLTLLEPFMTAAAKRRARAACSGRRPAARRTLR